MSNLLTVHEQKAALRKTIRSRFPGDEARNAESMALCAQLMGSDVYQKAACVAAYMPMRREIDVTPILRDVLQTGKRLLLPRVTGDGVMTFREITDLDQLVKGSFGLLEPAEDAPAVPLSEADLLLVPIEGIDRNGYRLGKGGGYYDRALPDYGHIAAAIVASWQWTDDVPHEAWDVRLTLAVDQYGLHSL